MYIYIHIIIYIYYKYISLYIYKYKYKVMHLLYLFSTKEFSFLLVACKTKTSQGSKVPTAPTPTPPARCDDDAPLASLANVGTTPGGLGQKFGRKLFPGKRTNVPWKSIVGSDICRNSPFFGGHSLSCKSVRRIPTCYLKPPECYQKNNLPSKNNSRVRSRFLQSGLSHEQWKNWLFRVYWGWTTTQLCEDC